MSLLSAFRRRKTPSLLTPYCGCVVAAAGSSARMGGIDKLFAPVDGIPVLVRTLQALSASPYINEITVVTRQETLLEVGALCRGACLPKVTQVIVGGDSRLESVYKGVNQLPAKVKLIAVHDGARCLVPQEVIDAAVLTAAKCNAAIPAVAVKDTIKEAGGDFVAATLDRSSLRAVQTPQVFQADLLRAALQKAMEEGWEVTDDSSAVERLGATVAFTPGDERNIKITTPIDLAVAEALLASADDL